MSFNCTSPFIRSIYKNIRLMVEIKQRKYFWINVGFFFAPIYLSYLFDILHLFSLSISFDILYYMTCYNFIFLKTVNIFKCQAVCDPTQLILMISLNQEYFSKNHKSITIAIDDLNRKGYRNYYRNGGKFSFKDGCFSTSNCI